MGKREKVNLKRLAELLAELTSTVTELLRRVDRLESRCSALMDAQGNMEASV